MISLKFAFLLLLTFFVSLTSPAQIKPIILPRVIYGIDDRQDVYESSDNLMKDLSRSVAVQIMDTDFTSTVNNLFVLGTRTLNEQGMCKSERFSDQVAMGHCTGFLIANDVLVTAGHCVRDTNSCNFHHWVFDYANYESVQPNFSFVNDQVYRCQKVISQAKDPATGLDYAVVKLDRKVVGRKAFKIRTKGQVGLDQVLTVLGFPSGLPLKITTGATVRDNTKEKYFVMNSDTYGGNSGSPVIDTKTGLVEGILVRGDNDFEKSPTEDCYISTVRDQNGGRGEDATRITEIKLK